MKYTLYSFLTLILLNSCQTKKEVKLPALVIAESQIVSDDNAVQFRDLNGNGALDIYEDVTQLTDLRISDLLSQMTLEEKAG